MIQFRSMNPKSMTNSNRFIKIIHFMILFMMNYLTGKNPKFWQNTFNTRDEKTFTKALSLRS